MHSPSCSSARAQDPGRRVRRPPRRPPQNLPAKVTEQLLSALPPYLTSLSYGMGVFSGEAAR
jgi:hypothetical protein